jgi:hypothetical protein
MVGRITRPYGNTAPLGWKAELRAGLGTVADLYRSEPEPVLLAI